MDSESFLPAGVTEADLAAAGAVAPDRATPNDVLSGPLKLSGAQRDIWFAQVLDPAGTFYNLAKYVEILGTIDPAIFRQAVAQAVEHSDSLRAVFRQTEDGPRQFIPRAVAVEVPFLDLTDSADPAAAALGWMRDDMARVFDLARGPLFRFALFKIQAGRFFWYELGHHLVNDGYGSSLFEQRVADHYRALTGAAAPEAATLSWGDYLDDEAEYQVSPQYAQDRQFWRAQLHDRPEAVTLSERTPAWPGAVRDSSGQIPGPLADRLRQVGAAHGASLAVAFIAVAALYLSRMTGARDLVLGVPVAARPTPRLRRIVGLASNVVPLRLSVDPAAPFSDLLRQTGRRVRDALRHQRYPAGALRQDLGLTPEHPALYGTTVNFIPTDEDADFAGLPVRKHLLGNWRVEDLWIEIHAGRRQSDLRLLLCANEAHYDGPALEGHRLRLQQLIATVVASPEQAIGRIDIVAPDERARLLPPLDPPVSSAPPNTVVDLFELQVARSPGAVAVICGDEQVSYAELDARADRLARSLADQGIGSESVVAVALPRSPELVMAMLGVMKSGAGYLPLDPGDASQRLAFMLRDSGAARLIATRQTLATLAGLDAALPPALLLDDPALRQADVSPCRAAPAAEGLAYLIYTSGSTGTPKGVGNTHAGLVNRLAWQWPTMPYGAGEVACAKTSLAFTDSITEMLAPLLQGVPLVVATPGQGSDPAQLAALLAAWQVTRLTLVPSLLAALLEHASALASLRVCVCSGEPLTRALADRFAAVLPHAQLWNFYGASEANGDSVAGRVGPGAGNPPIGRPIAGTRVYVLDAALDPLPVGVAGELYIAGAGLARGYLHRPALTAERFVADPHGPPGSRMYRSGDLARWRADGGLDYLGRADAQLKIRGFRVEPAEIEAALEALPGIDKAAVVARDEGGGGAYLAAYLVAAESPDPADLRTRLAASLPGHMIPAAFVWLDALPLTSSGKLDRRALPAPGPGSRATARHAEPQGELEAAVAVIWADLLGLERVGRDDNFFELGGHSLLVVALLERLRRRGWQVDMRAVFATPTLAGLAAAIEAGGLPIAVPANRIAADCAAITPDLLPMVALDQQSIDAVVASVPGGAPNVQDIYPLAPLQEGILVEHLMADAAAPDPYVIAVLLGFGSRGRLDGFLAALQAVVDRHDVLRTAILWNGLPEPVQVVWRRATLPVEHVETPAGDGPAAALWRRAHDRIDVRRAPMLRATVAGGVDSGSWLLLLQCHHLAVDRTTLDLMLAEIRAQLAAAHRLPPPLPFRDFVATARLGIGRAEHEAFFRDMLADIDEPTAPFGLLGAREDGAGISEARLALPADLAMRVRAQARRLGVTAASLFHLAWALVLARTSAPRAGGGDDVVFGTVLFGRMQGGAGADRALGLFINTLPLRLSVDGPIEQAVRDTHLRLARLLRHEHAALTLAQRCSAVPAPAPLFTALLNYRYVRPGASGLSADALGLPGVDLLRAEERTNYPFALSVDDLGTEFALEAQVAGRAGAARVCGYMQTALAQMVRALEQAPASSARSITMLGDAERQDVLRLGVATEAAPTPATLPDLFEAQVARTPHAVALESGEASLSYAALNARANRLAHRLIALGVGPGALVGLCVGRSPEMIIGLLAILKAGAAYLPLDPAHPTTRLALICEDSRPALLLASADMADRLPPCIPRLLLAGEEAGATDTDPHDADRHGKLTPDSPAYVIYTSGSTGTPKGVVVTHAGIAAMASVQVDLLGVTAAARVLQFASASFDASVWEVVMALATGAALVLAPADALSGPPLRALLTARRITHATLPPAALATIENDDGLADTRPPLALDWLVVAGEACPENLVARWAGGRRMVNAYGPTESTVCATMSAPLDPLDAGNPTIGVPILGTRVYVLDAALEPVPVGAVGELYIAGAGLARGYLNRPALTAERFVADPHGPPGSRMYRSGDLARWRTDGTLDFLGRADLQVKIRGVGVGPGEVEAALLAQPGIAQAAVVARDDGMGAYLAAYVVGDVPEPARLRSLLAARLPAHLVPTAFVTLPALPLTPNGKLDRRALPTPRQELRAAPAEPPQTPTEQGLARIWAAILTTGEIGRADNFFELGGHSLSALRVVARARDAFGVELPLRTVFNAATLAALAAEIDSALLEQRFAPRLPSIVPARPTIVPEPAPLSFSQERMWLIQSLDPASAAYNMGAGLLLTGMLDVPAMSGALAELWRRHAILRSTVRLVGDRPLQDLTAEDAPALTMVDLRDHGAGAGAEAMRLAEADARMPFDLARGPVLRMRLFRTGEADWLLLLVLHHIAGDQWSIGVLGRELASLYNAALQGAPSPLAPLSVTYRDYALWQRGGQFSAEFDRQLAFWESQLAGLPALELPTDRPRPLLPSQRGAICRAAIPAALVGTLDRLGRSAGGTLFMTMFAAFATLLHRMTGQHDIAIGVPVANRTQAATEGLVGSFVNTLVLRSDLSGNPAFAALLQRVRAAALDAFAHQDIPFDWLVQRLAQRRDANRAPLVQVMFNVTNAPMHGIAFDGLTWEAVTLDRGGAQFELSVSVDPHVTRELLVEYNTDLFDRATIERLAGQYFTLLEAAAAAPATRIGALALLPPEQRAILRDWNATASDWPDTTFAHLFAQQAARTPARVAVSFEGVTLSYAQLDAQSDALARVLRGLGVAPGALVGLCLPRSLRLLVALLGIMKAGGAYVPLDPDYPAARLGDMLADSGAAVLVTAGGTPAGLVVPDWVAVFDLDAPDRMAQPLGPPEGGAAPADIAYVIYTSGSTGRPKGVAVPHSALTNFLWSMRTRPGLSQVDVLAAVTTISFDIAALELYLPLLVGARIELVGRAVAADGAALARLLVDSGATVMQATPATWRLLLEAGAPGVQSSGLRALCGGEPLPRDLADALLGRVTELWNLYGPTETTIWSTIERVERGEAAIGIGRPIANTQIHILDAAGEAVPVGIAGEICIGGAGVALGYLGRPALTAERFVADAQGGRGARLYRTGDLGRWGADGRLRHLGRLDHQVKVRGFRIELGEIEAVLGEHPAVQHAVVVAREAQPGDQRLVAYVDWRDGEDLTASEVRRHLRRRLPDFMIPSIVMALEAMPLTPNGKLDRAALPDPFRAALRAVASHDPPAPGLEQTMAEIWQSVLSAGRISATDNFFELGGHSLLSLRVAQAVEQRTGHRMDPRTLFFNTLREVAALLEPGAPRPATGGP